MLNNRKDFLSSHFYSLLVILIVPLIIIEILIRLSIFTPYLPIKWLKNPWRYASDLEDDDFWKLYYIFGGEFKPPASVRVHSLLGWSQGAADVSNPLGLKEDSLKSFSSSKKQILFYGDSFVAGGVSSLDFEIPRYITKRLNNTVVIDLGCGGYGLDQMYLLFKSTHAKVHEPVIIFGIFVEDDLNRSILSVRTGQKPYYIVRNGKMILRGIPIDSIPAHYFVANPPKIKSYLFNLVFRATIGKTKWGINKKKNDIILINTKIIESIDVLCKSKGYSLLFVLFHVEDGIVSGEYWQGKFLKRLLHSMNIKYVDTADSLRSYSRKYNVKFTDFYVNEGMKRGHHNELGNSIISEGLIEYLSRENNSDEKD